MRLYKHKLLFVHVPRCGGTAINNAILKSGMVDCKELDYRVVDLPHLYGKVELNGRTIELDHCTYSHLTQFCSPYELDTFSSFAVVREPVGRMLSVYRRCVQESDWRILGGRGISSFTQFVRGLETLKNEGFFEYSSILEVPHANISHYFPQACYVCDAEGKVRVESLIGFENLEGSLEQFFQAKGIAPIKLPRSNVSAAEVQVDKKEVEELRPLLESIYSEDLRVLGA